LKPLRRLGGFLFFPERVLDLGHPAFKVQTMDESELSEAIENYLGYCTNCREFTTEGIEPDAENCRCEDCGDYTIHGTDKAVLLGYIFIK